MGLQWIDDETINYFHKQTTDRNFIGPDERVRASLGNPSSQDWTLTATMSDIIFVTIETMQVPTSPNLLKRL